MNICLILKSDVGLQKNDYNLEYLEEATHTTFSITMECYRG